MQLLLLKYSISSIYVCSMRNYSSPVERRNLQFDDPGMFGRSVSKEGSNVPKPTRWDTTDKGCTPAMYSFVPNFQVGYPSTWFWMHREGWDLYPCLPHSTTTGCATSPPPPPPWTNMVQASRPHNSRWYWQYGHQYATNTCVVVVFDWYFACLEDDDDRVCTIWLANSMACGLDRRWIGFGA